MPVFLAITEKYGHFVSMLPIFYPAPQFFLMIQTKTTEKNLTLEHIKHMALLLLYHSF